MAPIKSFLVFLSLFCSLNAQCSTKTAILKLRRANFDFTVDLLKSIALENDNHFVFSPLSLWSVLAVTAEGSTGQTYEELQATLGLSKHTCLNAKFHELVKNVAQESTQTTLNHESLFVFDNSVRIKQKFLSTIRNYSIGEKSLSFHDSYESARQVNDFVYTQTRGNIEEVVNPTDFKDARLLLVDKIFFEAKWNFTFNPENTAQHVFFDDDQNESGQLNMMYTAGKFHLADLSIIGADALELPYGSDGKYSMLVFLPKEDVPLRSVIDDLDMITMNAVYHKLRQYGLQNVEIYLPRFKIDSTLNDLKNNLRNLGIKRLFESNAQLDAMLDENDHVEKICHKASMEVSEKGTDVSAVTTETTSSRAMPALFQANKPFLYLIVENHTKIVIISGAFSKPPDVNDK